jgi:hypothetical protein
MGVRIDRVWNGSLSPLTITPLAGAATAIGLPTLAAWQVPMESVCLALDVVMEALLPGNWDVTRDPVTGAITISSTVPFETDFTPGFAAYWGFASTHYGLNLSLTSDAPVQYQIPDVYLSFGLPILVWTRSLVEHSPVVWAGPYAVFELVRTALFDPLVVTPPAFDPGRVPFVIYQDNPAPWYFDTRDGYLAVRPLATQLTRSPLNRTAADWGHWPSRVQWLNPNLVGVEG